MQTVIFNNKNKDSLPDFQNFNLGEKTRFSFQDDAVNQVDVYDEDAQNEPFYQEK